MVNIKELKASGVRIVYLNGFTEHIDYVLSLSLSNIKWVGETKSNDGYSMIQCFEQIIS